MRDLLIVAPGLLVAALAFGRWYYHRDSGRISAALRTMVLTRDGHRCLRCGATERLEMDHIRPWSYGGRTKLGNLQTLCKLLQLLQRHAAR